MKTKKKGGRKGGHSLVILGAVLVGAIESNDSHLSLILGDGPAPLLARDGFGWGSQSRWGRDFVLDPDVVGGGIGKLSLLFLIPLFPERQSHHSPGEVLHALSVREMSLRPCEHLPNLRCEGILFG